MPTLSGIESFENNLRTACAIIAVASFLFAIARLLFSLKRLLGRQSGHTTRIQRTGFFYILASLIFTVIIFLLWTPLSLTLSDGARWVANITGALILLTGLAGYQWGHYHLGKMFGGSTSFGAQLYADHKLIQSGPFAIVRHPMYLSLQIACFGALLLYRNWATLFLAIGFLGLVFRAKREEIVLAAEFKDAWNQYAKRVPFWIPKFK